MAHDDRDEAHDGAYHACHFCGQPFTVPCVCIQRSMEVDAKGFKWFLHFCPRCVDPELDEEAQNQRADFLYREILDASFEHRAAIMPGSA